MPRRILSKIILLIISSIFFVQNLSKSFLVYADEIFSDSFYNGYNIDAWQVHPGSYPLVPSPNGISVNPLGWSDILYHLNNPNTRFNVKLDLWINRYYVDSTNVLRIYVYNSTLDQWKIVNNWGPNNQLQVSEHPGATGYLVPWDHSVGRHRFEIILTPFYDEYITVKEDGTEIARFISSLNMEISYIGLGLRGIYGDYEYSNFILSSEPNPVPTPTPTPIPTTKVVVVPGMGASWNSDAILNCKFSDYTGDWTLASFADNIYNPILSSLQNAGWTILPFYYDWRVQIPANASKIKDFITFNTLSNEKVDFVGHSMGGLVGRAYIENEGYANKLKKLLTVGSPHRGASLAYPPWSGGEIWEDNLMLRIAITTLLKRCGGIAGNDRQTIHEYIPSVQNLLPVVNYLRNPDGTMKDALGMIAHNNWLPTTFEYPFFGAAVGTLAGLGYNTLGTIDVKDRTVRDARLGNWEDGKPTNRQKTNDGDGTVLTTSGLLEGAQQIQLKQTHSGLIASDEGINEILNFLGIPGSASLATQFVEPTSALVIMGYPAHFWVSDANGNVIRDKDGLVSFMNPKSGIYKLTLFPTSGSTLVIVGQFLPNGKTLWKEYTWKNILPKFGTIRFDSNNPTEEALY